jgi:hypothetical protein
LPARVAYRQATRGLLGINTRIAQARGAGHVVPGATINAYRIEDPRRAVARPGRTFARLREVYADRVVIPMSELNCPRFVVGLVARSA